MKNLISRFLIILISVCCLAGCLGQEDNGSELIEKARHDFVQGYYSQARDTYESYLKNYPKGEYRVESWNKLIDIAVIMHNNLDKGIELTEAMLLEIGQDNGNTLPVMDKLGDLYLMRGFDQKALEAWQRCLDIPDIDITDQARLYLKVAKVYRDMASYDFAMESLSDCIRICKENRENHPEGSGSELDGLKAECMYQLAQNAIFIQNWDYAESILNELTAQEGLDEEKKSLAYFMLADVYEHKREMDKVEELLLKIKDTYPNPNAVKARLKVLHK